LRMWYLSTVGQMIAFMLVAVKTQPARHRHLCSRFKLARVARLQ
jgi:hypothetical protein